jgi:hypothetical protein
MCRKTPDPSPTTEPARRSGRRTTALQLEESAELTATSGSAQTALKIYKRSGCVYLVAKYLLNGSPYWTAVPNLVEKEDDAVGIFVRKNGNQIELDFGASTKWFSAHAAEQGSWLVADTDKAAQLHSLWLQNKSAAAGVGDDGGADGDAGDTAGSDDSTWAPAEPNRNAQRPLALRNSTVAAGSTPLLRPVLPIKFPGVDAPTNSKQGIGAFFANTQVQATIRTWTLDSMHGDGLERHVPEGVLDPDGMDACDAMMLTTNLLVTELVHAMRAHVWGNGRRAPAELFAAKRLIRGLASLVSKARSGKLGALRRAGAGRVRALAPQRRGQGSRLPGGLQVRCL